MTDPFSAAALFARWPRHQQNQCIEQRQHKADDVLNLYSFHTFAFRACGIKRAGVRPT